MVLCACHPRTRSETVSNWRDRWHGEVNTEDDAVRFVDSVGFCTIDRPEFGEFPYLAGAFPGDRDSVLGEVWFWKDDLHIQKRLWYTRLFGGRPGFISLEFLPAFIATNGQVADELIMMGKLSVQTREIYETIEREGPISSKDLRRAISADARRKSASALIDLERKFILTKTDITGRTRETYSYVWDLAERWMPEVFEASDRLGAEAAAGKIVAKLNENGIPPTPDYLKRAFGWEKDPCVLTPFARHGRMQHGIRGT